MKVNTTARPAEIATLKQQRLRDERDRSTHQRHAAKSSIADTSKHGQHPRTRRFAGRAADSSSLTPLTNVYASDVSIRGVAPPRDPSHHSNSHRKCRFARPHRRRSSAPSPTDQDNCPRGFPLDNSPAKKIDRRTARSGLSTRKLMPSLSSASNPVNPHLECLESQGPPRTGGSPHPQR